MATQSRFSVTPKAAARAVASSAAAAMSARIVVLIRRKAEIGFHQPRLAAGGPALLGLERGRGRLGRLETLDDEVGDGARPLLVGDEGQPMGGVVRRQAFEHLFAAYHGPSACVSRIDKLRGLLP